MIAELQDMLFPTRLPMVSGVPHPLVEVGLLPHHLAILMMVGEGQCMGLLAPGILHQAGDLLQVLLIVQNHLEEDLLDHHDTMKEGDTIEMTCRGDERPCRALYQST